MECKSDDLFRFKEASAEHCYAARLIMPNYSVHNMHCKYSIMTKLYQASWLLLLSWKIK